MDDATVSEHAELECVEAVELMTAYLDGALTDGARTHFEEHLADCVGCDNLLDQLRHTVATTGRLADGHVPEPLRASLLQAFRAWQAGC